MLFLDKNKKKIEDLDSSINDGISFSRKFGFKNCFSKNFKLFLFVLFVEDMDFLKLFLGRIGFEKKR